MASEGNFGWPKITFNCISRHFRSIHNFFFLISSQNGRLFWMTENHFRSHCSPFQINTQLFFKNLSQNSRRPFWMTEKHFRSHFSPFQINTQLLFFWTFFFKMTDSGHFGSRFWPKSIGISLYSRSVATSNMKLIGALLITLWSAQAFSSYFHKMAAGGHFRFFRLSPKSIGFFQSWLCQI